MAESLRVNVTQDAALNVRLDGPSDARPILFSNSLGSDLSMWDGVVAALGDGWRCIRYDTRGHGGSDAPAGPYTIEALGGDAVSVLDAVGVERAAFCGLSLGGVTGMWLGANRPERFTHLVLANTAPHFEPKSMWTDRAAIARRGEIASLVEPSLERWFTPGFRNDNPAEVARGAAMITASKPEGYASCCEALSEADMRLLLPGIPRPTLVIVGEHDPSTPPSRGEEIQAGIPGAELLSFPTAHLSAIESPQAFAGALKRFLGGER
jgi:3-oxoadipate enol-lactonase